MTRSLNFFHQQSAAAIMMTLKFMEHTGRYLAKPHEHHEVGYLQYEE